MGPQGEPAGAPTSALQKGKREAMEMIWNLDRAHALHASFRLKVPDVLAKAESEGKPGLSAEEIVQCLPGRRSPGGPAIALNLTRLLDPLVLDGVYARSVLPDGKAVYSITDISRWLVEDSKIFVLGLYDFIIMPQYRKAADSIEHAILDDTKSPFELVHGTSIYESAFTDPALMTRISGVMTGWTHCQAPDIVEDLRDSGELRDVKTLVDVGGAVGTLIAAVVKEIPHVHGINYDFPKVVNVPEAAEGVQHIGGSFMESVPAGDAMLLKFIVHNHGDEESLRILQNCCEALPANGKAFIVEYVKPEAGEQNPDFNERMAVGMDLCMLATFRQGRERTLKEYEAMAKAAGFSAVKVISRPGNTPIIAAYKS